MKKYIIYIILAILFICGLFYMRDAISVWLSTVGTYVVISAVTFFLGWLLGFWGTRNRYKRRIKLLREEHTATLEKQRAELSSNIPSTSNADVVAKPASLVGNIAQTAAQK